jgi:hypothetical protein
LVAFPFFWALETRVAILIFLAFFLMINISHDLNDAVISSFFSEQFSTRVRYTGAALGHQFGAAITGFTPLIAGALSVVGGWPLVEPIPYTEVSNLEEAVHIARRSDGGGILLDTLHFQRYGGQLEQLRSVDRDLLAYVQLCDGPLAPPSDVPHPPSLPRGQSTDGTDLQLESCAMRLLPGDGELPLRAFLAALPAGIPVSVEAPVLSLQESLSPVEFARRARAAVADVVPENGGNPGR